MMLANRRTIEVELPEFLIRALLERVAQANASGSAPGDGSAVVDLNDLIEWELVESVSLQDVALLEQRMPGFAAAVSSWLATVTFEFE
jgi:hypothetical protein